nr:PREDICTED: RING finger protein 214-like [Anolis carolinensis]|eukprot:XP_016854741.1 PREDICTED: RING finger protein 214-like [Anolis carolinensis]
MMAGPKTKMDKDLKDNKGMARRPSQSEDISMKDIMKEIQKLAEKNDNYQKELCAMSERHNEQQKEMYQEMLDMKKEIKNEIGQLKQEIRTMHEEIIDLKKANVKLEKTQLKTQQRIEILENKNSKIERLQEMMEQKEMEYQLRFRNIKEEANEEIKLIIVKLLADMLQRTEQDMENEIDRTYRIHTNYSKRNKAPRDVIVHLVKKRIRDEILIHNNQPDKNRKYG